jgi:carbonic anhydrase/acetyltransferase-like protein (isoleucine patch superfamily)
VLSPGMMVPNGHVAMGIPAKVVREIRPEERAFIAQNCAHYVELAHEHATRPEKFYR